MFEPGLVSNFNLYSSVASSMAVSIDTLSPPYKHKWGIECLCCKLRTSVLKEAIDFDGHEESVGHIRNIPVTSVTW